MSLSRTGPRFLFPILIVGNFFFSAKVLGGEIELRGGVWQLRCDVIAIAVRALPLVLPLSGSQVSPAGTCVTNCVITNRQSFAGVVSYFCSCYY